MSLGAIGAESGFEPVEGALGEGFAVPDGGSLGAEAPADGVTGAASVPGDAGAEAAGAAPGSEPSDATPDPADPEADLEADRLGLGADADGPV